MDSLIAELAGKRGRWDRFFALLGPAAAGKTAVVQAVLTAIDATRTRTAYIDLRQARELWRPNHFYKWLSDTTQETLESNRIHTRRKRGASDQARLGWSEMVGTLFAKRSERVLLVFDHIESIADACAHDLISDLREIQNRSVDEDVWSRIRCVLCGSVSVYQLRRRANSPNLQFEIRLLPSWSNPQAAADTRAHLASLGREVADDAVTALADATGGEAAFLTIVTSYLANPCTSADEVEKAMMLAIHDASRYLELSGTLTRYVLDRRFRERADDLLGGRLASGLDPSIDIDPYQLAGAFVVGDLTRREVRFRNELVRRSLASLHAQLQSETDVPGEIPIALLQRRCAEATSVGDLIDSLTASWQQLASIPGACSLLLQDPVETRTFVIDHTSVHVESKSKTLVSQLELKIDRVQARVTHEERGWSIDACVTNHLLAGVRVTCAEEFTPSVARREILRLWALFLSPLETTLQRVGLDYLGRAALKGLLPHGRKRIFVSSTSRDLKEYRQQVMEQIIRRDLLFRGMEFFGAESGLPAERIVQEVRDADVYIGIFGMRYGFIDEESGLSMTELEYNEAELRNKEMLLYVFRSDAQVARADIEPDAAAYEKLQRLLARIHQRLVYKFSSPIDLARQVYTDLGRFA